MRELEVLGRAAQARQALRGARFGVLPGVRDHMHANLASPERLRDDFGPLVAPVGVEAYVRAVAGITGEHARRVMQAACARYEIDRVPDDVLERAIRAALGLEKVAADHRLDLLAVDVASQPLYDALRLRASLHPHLVAAGESGAEPALPAVIYQPETDLGAAAANFILQRLTHSPTMLIEFWYWDEAMNQMVGGHAGVTDPAMAEPGQAWISRDVDFCERSERLGAQLQLIARPGRATIFQLRRAPDGWRAIAASGVVIESLPVVEGYPHVMLRLDTPIDQFLSLLAEAGATQHWILAYGSVLPELEAFCQMENIPLNAMRY
jgi:hypothetical protein